MLEKELKVLTDFHSNGSYETIAQNFKLLDKKDYAYMVRTTDLETNNFSDNVKYVSKSTYEFLSKSKVFGGEVLINKIGSPGRTYIMPKLDMPVSLGMNLFLLRLKGNNIDENTLYLFLNSTVGKNIIQRKVNGTVPLTIDKKAIRSLYVPVFSHEFRKRLNYLMSDLNNASKEANTKYTQAENLLISELGLENFNPSNKKVSIKTLKESFLRTGRLDSEYYQPKYDEILNKITKYGCSEFTNFVDSYTTGYPYSSDSYVEKDGIVLIKISNINNFKLDISSASLIPKNDIDLSAENVVQKNDILVSMSGTIGNSCIVQDDIKAVVNQRIMKIKSKNINPVVFSLIINSMIGKNQLERIQTGGVQANISPKDILKIQIPCIKTSVQDEIASYIKQSMEYSKKAKELLEISTKSVEIAIDKNEQAAHNFLASSQQPAASSH